MVIDVVCREHVACFEEISVGWFYEGVEVVFPTSGQNGAKKKPSIREDV